MPVTAFTALACPLDSEALTLNENNCWQCCNKHSFDIARQGYVNLLPVQNKRSRDPGDSKSMVLARQRFLSAGHYQPIADALTQLVLNHCLNNPPNEEQNSFACLDAGCGEGYYLRCLAGAFGLQPLVLMGLDISKWAIQAAAKQDKAACWTVASNAKIPALSASLDSVLSIFGFAVYEEFHRVLKNGGQLIEVDAGPDHLCELRDIIYPSIKTKNTDRAKSPPGFSLSTEKSLKYSVELTSKEQIADLLTMTPHLYRASSEGKQRALALEQLTITVDAQVSEYKK